MQDQTSNSPTRNRIPWNFIGQVVLALAFFYLLSWLVNSLSFAGSNGMDPQATQAVSSLEIFDNFSFKVFDTQWNEATWVEVGSGADISQLDGVLTVSRKAPGFGGLVARYRKWRLSQINYVESGLRLSSDLQSQGGEIGVEIITTADQNPWFAQCAIQGGRGEKTASILCKTAGGFSTVPVAAAYDTWYIVRFEIDSETAALTFFVDGQTVGRYIPPEKSELNGAEYLLRLGGSSSGEGSLTGSFDFVQLKNK
jgi:hypothetical protein